MDHSPSDMPPISPVGITSSRRRSSCIEVYKKIKRERGEETALLLSARLSATHVVQLTESIAYLAADLSLRHGLAMADAIVYATAKDEEAELITGDADLKDLPGVVYVK